MIALVLERAGLDPTAVIGGRLSAFGSNARLGRGELHGGRGGRERRSFLKLSPTIAVITNIDHEHLESYGSFDDLQQAFVDFANKVPFYGAVVACADDEPVRGAAAADDAAGDDLRPRRARRPAIVDGVDDARSRRSARAARVDPARPTGPTSDARRAAAARARPPQPAERARPRSRSASSSGCRSTRIAAALAEFRGAERRFEVRGEARRRPGRRRLRPPSDRDRRGASPRRARRSTAGSSSRSSRTATRGRAQLLRRVRRRRSAAPTRSC